MGNKKKKLTQILYDHWLVIFAATLPIVAASVPSVRDKIFDFLKWPYTGWFFFGLLLFIVVLYMFIKKNKSNKHNSGVVVLRRPPSYRHEEYEPVERYGVNWHFWRGSNQPSGFSFALGDPRLKTWFDGPFCLECEYELEENADGTAWICANGHRRVKIPKNLQGDVRDKIIKIFDAELRQQERNKK